MVPYLLIWLPAITKEFTFHKTVQLQLEVRGENYKEIINYVCCIKTILARALYEENSFPFR